MKKLFTVALCALFAFLAVPHKANAATVEDILVVDMQLLMNESKAAKDIKRQVKNIRDKFQADMAKKKEKLQSEQKELQNKRTVLSPDEFKSEAMKFEQEFLAIQKDVREKQQDFDEALDKALDKVRENAVEIIAAKAKAKGAAIVLPRQNIVIIEPQMDMTQEVMAELDKKLTSVKVSY